MRPDEYMVTDANRMTRSTTHHRVLHHHAVRADLHWSAFSGEHRTKQHPAVRADNDVAAHDSGWCNVSRLVHTGKSMAMPDEHSSAPDRM